jgi:hypothetical protein
MKLTQNESTKTELPLFNYEFSKFIVLVISLQRREFLEHRVRSHTMAGTLRSSASALTDGTSADILLRLGTNLNA